MLGRNCLAGLLTLAFSNACLAGPENYDSLGDRPSSGHVDTPYYSFDYTAPSGSYESIPWNAFRDKSEARNSIMVIGMRGYDTFALSVLYKGQRDPAKGALEIARQQYPGGSFEIGPNQACANTSLDRPFELDTRMINFLAICVDGKSNAIYELSISWQSLILAVQSLDTVVKESGECASAKLADPATRCPDRIGNYSRSYRTFLSSFVMSGK